ncbi:MAG: response regulator [Gammaproteobacteria bacterium]|nr:response regulator [Gammaproteobacteria bacterium]
MADVRYKLLVVDDDMEIRQFVATVLGAELSCDLLQAANGKDALKLCREYSPDLVLLDVVMTGMDGFEVAKQLKRAAIPFVAMTALVESEHIRHLVDLGSFSFLAKPVSRQQLLGTVISALSRIAHVREIQRYADSAADIGTARGAISAYFSIHPDQSFDLLKEMARDVHGNVKDTAQVVNQFLDFLARANQKREARQMRQKKRS